MYLLSSENLVKDESAVEEDAVVVLSPEEEESIPLSMVTGKYIGIQYTIQSLNNRNTTEPG